MTPGRALLLHFSIVTAMATWICSWQTSGNLTRSIAIQRVGVCKITKGDDNNEKEMLPTGHCSNHSHGLCWNDPCGGFTGIADGGTDPWKDGSRIKSDPGCQTHNWGFLHIPQKSIFHGFYSSGRREIIAFC